MTQRLAPVVRWDTVIFVQRFRSRAADAWFTHFPFLGNELQYVLGFPFLAWFVYDTAVVRRFALAGAVSCFVANGLKDIFKLPRPPIKLHVGVGASHDLTVQQYGFPSTHAANALVVRRRSLSARNGPRTRDLCVKPTHAVAMRALRAPALCPLPFCCRGCLDGVSHRRNVTHPGPLHDRYVPLQLSWVLAVT